MASLCRRNETTRGFPLRLDRSDLVRWMKRVQGPQGPTRYDRGSIARLRGHRKVLEVGEASLISRKCPFLCEDGTPD
jgi:hypothetical protein